MTPERIAELRTDVATLFSASRVADDYTEMLDEIERLAGIITARHRPGQTDGDCTCGVSLIDAGCPLCEYECWVWADDEQTSTTPCQCAVDAHAAHVAAILDGGGA